ncbi:sulfotransferase domain-containing protein [Coleofasciculus sp. E1-EBD-02]|uniref:sulfotransferase domain-containing protein n=1 Tax=Coleofasciculus sp. E1-EBD-02 TaxID=3068481 RepID=UPI004063DB11
MRLRLIVIASIEDYTRNKNLHLSSHQYIFQGQLFPSHIILAWHWKYAFQTIIRQGEILGDKRYVMLKYEDLVAEPRSHIERLCELLNCRTDFIDDMLKFQEDAKNLKVRKESSKSFSSHHIETTKKINKQRIGRYKTTLSEQQIGDIEFICGDMIKDIGYEAVTSKISVARQTYTTSLYNLLLLSWKGLRATRRIRGSL